MRKILLTLLITVLCGLPMISQTQVNKWLVAELKSGTKLEYLLSEKLEVGFMDKGMISIKYHDGADELQILEVEGLRFEDRINVEVRGIEEPSLRVEYISDGMLHIFNNSDTLRQIGLFDLSGNSIKNISTKGHEEAVFNIATFPSGIYILKADNNETVKIIKK